MWAPGSWTTTPRIPPKNPLDVRNREWETKKKPTAPKKNTSSSTGRGEAKTKLLAIPATDLPARDPEGLPCRAHLGDSKALGFGFFVFFVFFWCFFVFVWWFWWVSQRTTSKES